MYNRYMNSGGFEDFFKPVEAPAPPPAAEPEVPVEPVEPTENKPKGLSSVLKNLTGGGLKLPEFDTDTLLLLVLGYFLVADDDSNLSDTLLIIGILLLLGF